MDVKINDVVIAEHHEYPSLLGEYKVKSVSASGKYIVLLDDRSSKTTIVDESRVKDVLINPVHCNDLDKLPQRLMFYFVLLTLFIEIITGYSDRLG